MREEKGAELMGNSTGFEKFQVTFYSLSKEYMVCNWYFLHPPSWQRFGILFGNPSLSDFHPRGLWGRMGNLRQSTRPESISA